jgi:uncharacterized protein YndB with AHSA1/START domain
MKDVISKEYVFSHTIDQVWNAITKAEEISSWFLKTNFKAVVGYKYEFNSEEENCSVISGEVKEAQPFTLVYTWIVAETTVETTVKWVLEEVESGTKLYLEHSGIAKYEGETAIKMFNSFNGGWDNCIESLTVYLTKAVHAG